MKAVITGATRGIGRAIAIRLAKAGYDLAICSRNENELQETKAALEQEHIRVIIFPADCRMKKEVADFCYFVEAQWGRVDVLVNNAGIYQAGPWLDEEDSVFEDQLAVNLEAPYHFSKFFGKMMRRQQSGHIFNICSIASLTPVEIAGSYSVTKTALLCLNNIMRQEMAQHGVKVTAILPGATLTSSWDDEPQPQGKFVKPGDIAEVIFTALTLSGAASTDQVIIKPL